MSAEPDPIRAALYSHLAGDATLMALATGGVHHEGAPEGAEPPYVIFSRPSNLPIWSYQDFVRSQLWLVKGVCRGRDAAAAEAIDTRCEVLLNKVELEIPGVRLLGLRRESGMPDLSEADAGQTIYQRGGIYRLMAEPA